MPTPNHWFSPLSTPSLLRRRDLPRSPVSISDCARSITISTTQRVITRCAKWSRGCGIWPSSSRMETSHRPNRRYVRRRKRFVRRLSAAQATKKSRSLWNSCAQPWTSSCKLLRRRCAGTRNSFRPLDRNTRMLSQQDLKSMLDRLENLARSGNKDAARRLLEELQSMLENLQMARPGASGDDDDDDMMSALDELGDMIRKQQQLRDKTFRQGQDNR